MILYYTNIKTLILKLNLIIRTHCHFQIACKSYLSHGRPSLNFLNTAGKSNLNQKHRNKKKREKTEKTYKIKKKKKRKSQDKFTGLSKHDKRERMGALREKQNYFYYFIFIIFVSHMLSSVAMFPVLYMMCTRNLPRRFKEKKKKIDKQGESSSNCPRIILLTSLLFSSKMSFFKLKLNVALFSSISVLLLLDFYLYINYFNFGKKKKKKKMGKENNLTCQFHRGLRPPYIAPVNMFCSSRFGLPPSSHPCI
ncbi:hypothetical protein PUN28_011922 [Cardiocondyla obscurior]|uniref:Uncharacterized protein n=1 Tax=Cardiocondyla obscurior TaxID=286306 RepID=A0AAW2FAC8_9HYME